MPKKILLPTPDYIPQVGGVARYIDSLKQMFGDVFEVQYWPEDMPRGKDLVEAIRKSSADKDEIWANHIYPVGNALRKLGKSYSIILHGMDFDMATRNIARRYISKKILKQAKNVIVNSESLADEVKDLSGVSSLVLYPTPSRDFIDRAVAHGHIYDDKVQTVTLLTVSRFVERKGHLKVLEAMKDLDNVNYIIVGKGEFQAEIENKIKELNLSDRVELLADVGQDEVHKAYQSADIFAQPVTRSKNEREGFGIVYLEAALYRLPSIAVNDPGVNEAVLDDQTGILIKDTVAELKTAIEKLATDKTLRQKMGEAGRKRVLSEFTPEIQFGKLRRMIQ